MKYKLIVLDLDGTLTNSKKEITPRNRETLIRMQEQGIRLVLASGRPTYGIVPLANELRMNEFGDSSCPITEEKSLIGKHKRWYMKMCCLMKLFQCSTNVPVPIN